MKFNFKKRKIYFKTLFSPSFDVLHSSSMVNVNHTELIFQDLYCTKKVPENHINFVHFCHGGDTHFLVLAQTLIYRVGGLRMRLNKPAAQASGADPSRCSSTNRQNPPLQ